MSDMFDGVEEPLDAAPLQGQQVQRVQTPLLHIHQVLLATEKSNDRPARRPIFTHALLSTAFIFAKITCSPPLPSRFCIHNGAFTPRFPLRPRPRGQARGPPGRDQSSEAAPPAAPSSESLLTDRRRQRSGDSDTWHEVGLSEANSVVEWADTHRLGGLSRSYRLRQTTCLQVTN